MVDLNCDMGEGFGIYSFAEDDEIMPFIDAANVACGFHASDPNIMRKTVELAKKHNVKVSVVSPGFIKTPLTDKNEFPMPFLRSPEFAADKVYDGLVKTNAFEIDFPKQLTFTLKFLRILPYKIYLFLVDKLVKR